VILSRRPLALVALALAGIVSSASASAAQTTSVLSLVPVEDEALEVGSEVTGTLSATDLRLPSDAHLDAWELTGAVGSSVTVDLRSDDFDVVLYVVGPGLAETLFDDDSGGGCDARLTLTFLEDGPYRVAATSLAAGTTGTYTLRVTERPEPAPEHGCGEPDPSALGELDTEDRRLRMGSVETGRFDFLTPSAEGRPVQAWALEVTPGEPLSITQRSTDFDSYLYVIGPDIPGVAGDDDSAGDLDSRVELTPTTEGPYTVVASALGEGAAGSYTLLVEEPLDLATIPAVGTVDVGGTVDGLLGSGDPFVTDGRRGQAWALEGTAGARVTIELVSDAFDAFLYVAGPGLTDVLTDDDGAGDLNSRLSLTFPESGEYRVIVSALGGDVSGPFTLRVSPS
jgi:hypothetical protein